MNPPVLRVPSDTFWRGKVLSGGKWRVVRRMSMSHWCWGSSPIRVMRMDTLRRKKWLQSLGLAGSLAVVAALVVFSAMRPAPEDEASEDLQQAFMTGRLRDMNEDDRAAMRGQWRQLSPESRQAVFAGVARQRLEEMRRETAELTSEQRLLRIQKALADMRKRREALPLRERQHIRERLAAPEAQEMVRHVMTFYQTELTARERAELDPLLHEWLAQLELALR